MMERKETTITCHDDVEDAGLPLCPHLVCRLAHEGPVVHGRQRGVAREGQGLLPSRFSVAKIRLLYVILFISTLFKGEVPGIPEQTRGEVVGGSPRRNPAHSPQH
jgi:hypothetical protein